MASGQAAAPKGLVVAVVVATVVALVGVVFLGLMLRERNAGAVSVGGLTLRIQSAQWVQMEHGSQDGFQMPAQMMPGAPSHDQQRLVLAVTISNRGDRAMQFRHDEFSLQAPDGQVVPMVADDLGGETDPSDAFDGLSPGKASKSLTDPGDGSGAAPDVRATPVRAGLGLDGTFSFDLPATSASQASSKGLTLLWSREGKVMRVPVTIGTAAPEHHH
jgi:hypothetical protein